MCAIGLTVFCALELGYFIHSFQSVEFLNVLGWIHQSAISVFAASYQVILAWYAYIIQLLKTVWLTIRVKKYEKQEEEDKEEEVHLSNSELRLRRIAVFAGKQWEIWLFKVTQRFWECLCKGNGSCKFCSKLKIIIKNFENLNVCLPTKEWYLWLFL